MARDYFYKALYPFFLMVEKRIVLAYSGIFLLIISGVYLHYIDKSITGNAIVAPGTMDPGLIVPFPQNVTVLSATEVITVDSSWEIIYEGGTMDNDSVEFLQEKMFEFNSLNLSVSTDTSKVLQPKKIVIGNPVNNIDMSVLASSLGIDYSSEVVKGFGQGYILMTTPDGIYIFGNTTAGTFYGTVSLIWLFTDSSGDIILPNVKITDWPDLILRGFYGSGNYYATRADWVDELAMHKYNVWTHAVSEVKGILSPSSIAGRQAQREHAVAEIQVWIERLQSAIPVNRD